MAAVSCRMCESPARRVMSAPVRGREVAYFRCPRCEYLQTEEPRWLEEIDPARPSPLDTGRLARCLSISRTVAPFLWWWYGTAASYLDYGGGHGLLTRRMRDLGFDFYHYDPGAANLFARGFEDGAGPREAYRLVTAFEVFEHLRDPAGKARDMLEKSRDGDLLFSTRLYGEDVPDPDWWYYLRETGEHVGFFNATTLRHLGERLGRRVYTDGRGLHLFTGRDLPPVRVRLALRHGSRLFPLIRGRLGSRTESDRLHLRERTAREQSP